MKYNWKMHSGKTIVEGSNKTLHDVIDHMVYYSRGNTIRDFYINGHHMNEEFDLIIIDGKVLHAEDESEFVPMNEWYDLLKPFRPQPTRGSAPQNPATLAGSGEAV